MTRLSVIIPCFNERTTIREIVQRVLGVDLQSIEIEIVLVDDGSTDGSAEVIAQLARREPKIHVITHPRNRGKGAALRSAQSICTGDFVIIQDADLEYDPKNYPSLLAPLLAGQADAVYGSRFAGGRVRRVLLYSHEVGNRFLTALSNLATDFNLTDMSTGAKVFRGDLFRSIPICCNGFGFEPEITAKLARLDCRLYEVPIDYHGRSYLAGKKIRWKDGLLMALSIIRFLLSDGLKGVDEGLETLQSMRWAQRYNRWVIGRIAPFIGDRVLEAGAGIGNLTAHLLDRELIVAADDNSSYLERLTANFANNPNVQATALDLEITDELLKLREHRFDTVVCVNVIEHLKPDEEVLRSFFEILEPGGRAIILAPHGGWLYGSIDRALDHHRRYSRSEMRKKMERAGFTIEEIFGLNRIAPPFWFFNGRVLRRTSVPGTQIRFFDRLVPMVKILDRLLPLPPLSIIAIGCKGQGAS
jgi:glycosyltransferase involved in cell wall biosynthesis/intracellular sulfur oxidation DsrE/DsrF family protein